MSNAGPALMGIGYGVGGQRALQAAQSATSSPLLEQTINGAKGLLVNITSGDDLTLAETTEAMNFIHDLCDDDEANIFFGTVVDPDMEGAVRISVLATGFDPYTPEGRKAAEATFAAPEPQANTPQPVPVPVDSARAPWQRISSHGVAPVGVPEPQADKQTSTPEAVKIATDRAAVRSRGVADVADLYDDSEIDIPTFIRDHKARQN